MSGCRGCSGTCCTGVGSDPCVCPDPEPLECPEEGCTWETAEADTSVRAIAFRSHLKTHDRLPDGPRIRGGKSGGSSSWGGKVADAVGDAVEGAFDALGRLLD